jgi:hypothetical protein
MIRKGPFYILTIFLFCQPVFAASSEPNLGACEQRIKKACDTITIFITGNELGELRPCGCSGGQLGGFDRRATILKSVAPEQRMIIDTGNFIKTQTEQSFIKLDIIMQAFSMLGYDVVNLTAQDLVNLDQMQDMPFKLIAAQIAPEANLPQIFSKRMQLGSKSIQVITAAVGDESSLNIVDRLEAASPAFRILIFDGSENDAEKHLAEFSNANVVISQADSDEPGILKLTDNGPMLISAGRLGKYVGRLDIRQGKTGFEFTCRAVPITENLAQDPAFIELYKSYQAIVKNQELLKNYPRYVLPDGLKYVGSSTCGLKGCHDYEYKTAISQKHAIGFESLVLVGSDYDPECVVCHSVGMEYNSGFITETNTPELKDVGCENCHGPGSKHIVTAGKAKTTGPKSKCIDCHTSEQSANYAGQQEEYCEKIFHWREPNALDCVQY